MNLRKTTFVVIVAFEVFSKKKIIEKVLDTNKYTHTLGRRMRFK